MASRALNAKSGRTHEPRAPRTRRVELDYQSYRIVAGDRNGVPVALAYSGGAVALTTDGETVDQALESLKQIIDFSIATLLKARGDNPPSADDYRAAMTRLPSQMPDASRKILQIHHALPDHASTLANLATLARCEVSALIADYARLGRQLAKSLHFTPVCKAMPRTILPLLTMAEPQSLDAPDTSLWVLRPSLADALDALEQK